MCFSTAILNYQRLVLILRVYHLPFSTPLDRLQVFRRCPRWTRPPRPQLPKNPQLENQGNIMEHPFSVIFHDFPWFSMFFHDFPWFSIQISIDLGVFPWLFPAFRWAPPRHGHARHPPWTGWSPWGWATTTSPHAKGLRREERWEQMGMTT